MSSESNPIDLADDLLAWVEKVASARVVFAEPHFTGASREAWKIDVAAKGGRRPLFLLRDKGAGNGSQRDAAVLRALAPSSVPVPRVLGHDAATSTILLERIPGRSDFPAVDRESEREPTAKHLMEVTADLHGIEIGRLHLDGFDTPRTPQDCARPSLDQATAAYRALGEQADPFFGFALTWLEANLPNEASRRSLVHSDMGPGNFLYEGGRVTGVVDWEVAHFGDPMEDLAAISIRDMATPVGHLPTRFREYEAASGAPVDLTRVNYYRALVLVRNSLMIGLGLAHPSEGFDVVEMTMFQTLLTRAAALVLCDNLAIDRPTTEDALPEIADGDRTDAAGEADDRAKDSADVPGRAVPGTERRRGLIRALRQEMVRVASPSSDEENVARLRDRMIRGLDTLEHEERIGSQLDRREADELGRLLGGNASDRTQDLSSLEQALRARVAGAGEKGQPLDLAETARYFARRLHRLAERRRPLMGALLGRLPQPLEGEPTSPEAP